MLTTTLSTFVILKVVAVPGDSRYVNRHFASNHDLCEIRVVWQNTTSKTQSRPPKRPLFKIVLCARLVEHANVKICHCAVTQYHAPSLCLCFMRRCDFNEDLLVVEITFEWLVLGQFCPIPGNVHGRIDQFCHVVA